MKIEAAILLGGLFIIQLIPSESAPMNEETINTTTTTMKSILVATGLSRIQDPYEVIGLVDVQVVNPNQVNVSCTLPPLPKGLYRGTGGVVDDTIIICGGYVTGKNEGWTDTCQIFDNESYSWKLTEMTYTRTRAASVSLNGALWVTGGRTAYSWDSDTTELVYPNGTVTPGPKLPMPKKSHCMVTLENGHIMFIGGDLNDGEIAVRDVVTYDPSTGEFKQGPSTIKDRWNSGCALFRSPAHGNRPVVISAGGSWVSGTVELLDYTIASEWQLISSLPSGYGTNWPQSRALTSLDGKGAYLYSNGDQFFELNCETDCKWSVMSQKLPNVTKNAIMMYLPPNISCF